MFSHTAVQHCGKEVFKDFFKVIGAPRLWRSTWGLIMRNNFLTAIFLAAVLSFSFGAVSSPAQAQGESAQLSVADQVALLLEANPDGGQALADGIAALLTGSEDPAATAEEILAAIAGATPAQKAAVGQGFAVAQAVFAANGNTAAANAIAAAVANSSDDAVKTAYTGAGGTYGSVGGSTSGGTASTGLISNNTGTGSGSDSTSPR